MTTIWPPGPWLADPNKGEVLIPVDDNNPNGFAQAVIELDSDFLGHDRTVAVTHLLSAAPDLYEHSKALLESIWDGVIDRETLPAKARDAIEGLTAALAKARGEA